MSEQEYSKFKRAIFVAVSGQIVAFVICGLIYIGSFKAEASRNIRDIELMKIEIQNKVGVDDMNRVIKHNDDVNKMIIDELKDIKDNQRLILNKIIKDK